jgi:hypothetical protein
MGSNTLQPSLHEYPSCKTDELDQIYAMLIEVAQSTSGCLEPRMLNKSKAFSIKEVSTIIAQIMAPFTKIKQYAWGQEIWKRFDLSFRTCFMTVWEQNKS